MPLKWLLLLVFGYLVYRWWMRASLSGPAQKPDETGEKMVICAQCAVHFPQSEAVLSEDRVFCCDQHCKAWKQSL
jgi:uncharacterized protein